MGDVGIAVCTIVDAVVCVVVCVVGGVVVGVVGDFVVGVVGDLVVGLVGGVVVCVVGDLVADVVDLVGKAVHSMVITTKKYVTVMSNSQIFKITAINRCLLIFSPLLLKRIIGTK